MSEATYTQWPGSKVAAKKYKCTPDTYKLATIQGNAICILYT